MKNLTITLAAIAVVLFTGCNSQPKPVVEAKESCTLPSGYHLDSAIEHGVRTIKECPNKYEDVMQRLFKIAEEKKSSENKVKLARVVEASIDSYSIPEDRGRKEFKEYFSSSFVTIPKKHKSIFSECKNMDQIKSNMWDELMKKKIGFTKIQGDEKGFTTLSRKYKSFVTSFEILCESQNIE